MTDFSDMFPQRCDNDREWQLHEMKLEEERMALDALRRCEDAGADHDDVILLAAILGLSNEYGRMARP